MDETMTVPESEPGAPVSGGEIEVGASKPAVFAPNTDVKKVVVAVHGIGDQYSFATIQSVVNQFCVYFGHPAAVPLGNFHSTKPAYSLPEPYPEDPFKRFAFTEVYWAPISRDLANEKHTLEEAKTWARTIVERLRLRWHEERKRQGWEGDRKAACRDEDFGLAQQVLSEMIQTIAVAERLCFLADKAGLFTFDVRKLLDDYLGDVQVVAEFKDHRDKILGTFARLLEDIEKAYPEAEVYIVAHSEGTVVALLGLLQAFRAEEQPRWTQKVRGFMTLGSPIDKHLALWPELFGEGPPSQGLTKPIEWRNYYDLGDPVGFDLDSIREWIQANNWSSVFHFKGKDIHDFGFARYPLPGKAHVDYWTDREVFGHFIAEVVEKEEPPPAKPGEPRPKPPNKLLSQMLSYAVPYGVVFALLFLAAFVIYKAVTGVMGGDAPSSGLILRRSVGLAALLFGLTAVARIPRLTNWMRLRVASFAIAGSGALIYLWSVKDVEETVAMGPDLSLPLWLVTLGAAAVVAVLTFGANAKWPSLGVIPLMVTGSAAVISLVIYHLGQLPSEEAKNVTAWPIVLATAGFLYLWWLAALLFDLVFIWHLYIRRSRLMMRINQVLGTYKERMEASSRQAAQAGSPAIDARRATSLS